MRTATTRRTFIFFPFRPRGLFYFALSFVATTESYFILPDLGEERRFFLLFDTFEDTFV